MWYVYFFFSKYFLRVKRGFFYLFPASVIRFESSYNSVGPYHTWAPSTLCTLHLVIYYSIFVFPSLLIFLEKKKHVFISAFKIKAPTQ